MSCSQSSRGATTCIVCFESVEEDKDDALQLTCQSGHTLCSGCSVAFSKSVLATGHEAVMPLPKCSICPAGIPAMMFERVLTPELLDKYRNYVAMGTLDEGERVLHCVGCQYYEVRTDDPPLFFCRNPLCQVVHCAECKVTCPALMDIDDDEDAFMEGQELRLKHLMCQALREQKTKFDEALAAGNGVPCPGCGVIGRKDGMCTHMTCVSCDTRWCYLCGLSVDECDKLRNSGSIYGHNQDWQSNPKRCPMFMNRIGTIDSAWDLEEEVMNDDGDQEELEEKCLDKFHKWRALRKLKTLRDELGAKTWKQLHETFPTVRNCGYSDEEIDSAGEPLFRRQTVIDLS